MYEYQRSAHELRPLTQHVQSCVHQSRVEVALDVFGFQRETKTLPELALHASNSTGTRCALPLIAAVAIHQLCDNLGINSTLKWPNDILVRGKKLAGILCEARIHGEQWHAVIGVGLNLAPPTSGWPQNLHATSIHEEIGVVVDRIEVASRLIDQLDDVLHRFKVGGMSWLIAQWTLRGPELGTVFAHNGKTGTYEGLTNEGAIRLRIDGSISIITAGDVELV